MEKITNQDNTQVNSKEPVSPKAGTATSSPSLNQPSQSDKSIVMVIPSVMM